MRKAQRKVKTELSTRYKVTDMFSSPWGRKESDTTEQLSTIHSMFKEKVCKNVYHANTCQKKAHFCPNEQDEQLNAGHDSGITA